MVEGGGLENRWARERLLGSNPSPSATLHLRACLHAKGIVIDDHRALITSADFTEAAHKRNIEAGTVITDAAIARALRAQFDTLVDRAVLKRVPGLHAPT